MALREINLIPADIIDKKFITRRLVLWAGCLSLSLALIAGFYLYQVQMVLPRKRPATTVEEIHEQLGATMEEIRETQQEIQGLSLQESFLDKLTRFQPFSSLLLRLSEIINSQTWLTKLTIESGKEEESETPGIKLDGFSMTHDELGNLLTQLSVEPMFKTVVLKYAKETQRTRLFQDQKALITVIQFQIDCKISKAQ